MNSAELFATSPIGTGEALGHVCQIFSGHWKPLLTLAGIQILSFMGTIIVLGLLSLLVAAPYINSVINAFNNNRFLLDYFVGVSGASRLLDVSSRRLGNSYWYYAQNYYGYLPSLGGWKYTIAVTLLFITWIVVVSLVGSIFLGAFCHMVAEVYAGLAPSADRSIKEGKKKMKNIFIFQLLRGLIVTVLLLIMLVPLLIMLGAAISLFGVNGLLALGIVLIPTFAIQVAMTAAVPSIVVEDSSAIVAAKRSLNLCKSSMGFVFCTSLCFEIGMLVIFGVTDAVLMLFPDVLVFLGHLIMQLVITALYPM